MFEPIEVNTEVRQPKVELYHDNLQNYKRYNIPPAQLVIADIPYNIGNDAYGSSLEWYEGGDIKNGESAKAGKQFFNSDANFNIAEFMHFANKLIKKEPKQTNSAGAMIVFCAYQQMHMVTEYGKKYGFKNSFPLIFTKKTSGQVLKANMRIVGATEYAVVLYRDKLPKFNNGGRMVLNHMPWVTDNSVPKIHPTQKPIPVLKRLIEIFTDPGDVVIDPVAGSGSTLRAAAEMGRDAYGFEVYKEFYDKAQEEMLTNFQVSLF